MYIFGLSYFYDINNQNNVSKRNYGKFD